jgi:hypothetical protein
MECRSIYLQYAGRDGLGFWIRGLDGIWRLFSVFRLMIICISWEEEGQLCNDAFNRHSNLYGHKYDIAPQPLT